MLPLVMVSVFQRAGAISEVTRLQQYALHLFACDHMSKRLPVVKGEKRSVGAGAKSLGLKTISRESCRSPQDIQVPNPGSTMRSKRWQTLSFVLSQSGILRLCHSI